MMARAVKQISTSGRVQIEEDTRNNNDLLFQAGLEEVEAVGNMTRQTLEVEPDVERAVRHVLDHEAHVAETLDNIVSLVAEMSLKGDHLLLYQARLKHGDCGLLERSVGTTIEVRTT